MSEEEWPINCDTCGEIAIINFWDMKETTEPGGEYRTWEHDGPLHSRCKQHNRESKFTYLDGRVTGRPATQEGVP